MSKNLYFLMFIGFLIIFCSFPTNVKSGQLIKGEIAGDIYGELIKCAFPNTVVLDGKLNDQAWRYATWHYIEAKDATVPADNNKDCSLKFAVVADDKYIYFAAEVIDDVVQSGENSGCDVWNDDSAEVYIDGENDKASSYDANDAQITMGADLIGQIPDVKITAALLGGCVGITQGPATETIATGSLTKEGWILEAGIPLKNSGWNIKIKNGLKIGFNVQYNDDDDKSGRDHKLIWCVREVKQGEGSWSNPSLFAELEFVQRVLAVDHRSSIATTWASIKTE